MESGSGSKVRVLSDLVRHDFLCCPVSIDSGAQPEARICSAHVRMLTGGGDNVGLTDEDALEWSSRKNVRLSFVPLSVFAHTAS